MVRVVLRVCELDFVELSCCLAVFLFLFVEVIICVRLVFAQGLVWVIVVFVYLGHSFALVRTSCF